MPGVIARMPISMDPLALVFIVVSVSDSYALAGALSATSSVVMALATPHWSRVADRMGQEDKIGVLLAICATGSAVATIINGVVEVINAYAVTGSAVPSAQITETLT